MGRILVRLAVRLWGLVLLVSSGYLWGMRGRRWTRAWKVGTLTCIILAILGLLCVLNYL